MHFHLFYVKIKGIMVPNVDPIIDKRGRLHIFAWLQFKPPSTHSYYAVLDIALINQYFLFLLACKHLHAFISI